MIYKQALSQIIDEVLSKADHKLLVSINVAELELQKLFVTCNGKTYKGTFNSIKQQLSSEIRFDVWKNYKILKEEQLIFDEPSLGTTLVIQKTFLEQQLELDTLLHNIVLSWFNTPQIYV